MEHNEILKEMDMDYETLVGYLKAKYGVAKYDYFINTTCKTKNSKVTRTKEGLFCHHIDEDKGCDLGERHSAAMQPYEYQKAERLVYCNYLEHLLLHIRIGKDRYWERYEKITFPKEFEYFIMPGTKYICCEINELFANNGSAVPWRNRCFKEIECDFDVYIYILKTFIQYMEDHYAGDKNKSEIYVGKQIKHELWGKGIITKISNEEETEYATVKFEDYEMKVEKNIIERETYENTLIRIKKRLSSNWNGEIVKLIYNKLN